MGVFSLNINLSGAENEFPSWPSMAEMAYWVGKGVRGFRIPLHWEDMQPALGGSLDTTSTVYSGPNTPNVSYMACVSQCIANAASLGATVLIDVHNSGRYREIRIGEDGGPTVAQYVDFISKMSAYFRSDPNRASISGYDPMNEWHDMDPAGGEATPYAQNLLKSIYQGIFNALRAAGDNTKIHIEGLHYSGAWDWVANNAVWVLALTDPANNFVLHTHCYLGR